MGSLNGVEGFSRPVLSNSMATTSLRMVIARVLMLPVLRIERLIRRWGWEGCLASQRLGKGIIPSCISKPVKLQEKEGIEEYFRSPRLR